ncbi:MAG: restriction endonuclease subunit S, partial [Vicinamibacterales bacterium]
FLDRETARIDALVAKKERLIELLLEKRAALVTRAVTKGLDPNVPMKDLGVAWLGEIPAHWDVARMWRISKAVSGGTPAKEERGYWDGDIPWVSPKDMKRRFIDSAEDTITERAIAETGIKQIAPPVVLIVVRGMILAHTFPVAITTVPVTINQDMKALKPLPGVNAEFLARSLDSAQEAFVPLIDEAGHGTRRLPTERWRDLAIAMPSEDEQAAIVEFLTESTHTIVTAIDRAQRQIVLGREYRTRLIADVVTGKLDVREAAAKLPDEADDAGELAACDELELSESDDELAMDVAAAGDA